MIEFINFANENVWKDFVQYEQRNQLIELGIINSNY